MARAIRSPRSLPSCLRNRNGENGSPRKYALRSGGAYHRQRLVSRSMAASAAASARRQAYRPAASRGDSGGHIRVFTFPGIGAFAMRISASSRIFALAGADGSIPDCHAALTQVKYLVYVFPPRGTR
jgi:hypothetical protein